MVVATRSAAPARRGASGRSETRHISRERLDLSTRSRVAGVAGALLIAVTSVSGVLASSHREAPLIAGDPAADNTDLYAFVSPDATEQPDDHRQLRPAPGAGRWPELLPVRPGRPLRDQRRQQRQRQGRRQVPVPVQDPSQGQELRRDPDVPLQRRRDHEPERPEPARLADLRRLAQRPPDRLERSGATGQHRPAIDRRLFALSPARRCKSCPTARASSPVSATTPSSSTSARSSTWPGSDRSTPFTRVRSRPSPASMVSAGSTRTRSPSASRSAS